MREQCIPDPQGPIFGTETEFGLQLSVVDPLEASAYKAGALVAKELFAPANGLNERGLLADIINDYLPSDIAMVPGYNEIGGMLENGARLYLDGHKPEASTPEDDDLDSLVCSEHILQEVMTEIFRAAVDDQDSNIQRVILSLGTVDQKGNNWGYHENHLVPRDFMSPNEREKLRHSARFDILALHLATRGIYAGSGRIQHTEGQTLFVASQKLSVVRQTFGYETTVDVTIPLVNTRDRAHANPEHYARLHITSGDTSISDWELKMKVGTTKLILQAMQAGFQPQLGQVNSSRLAAFAVTASHDLTGQCAKMPFVGEGPLSALDIQKRLRDMVRKYLDTKDQLHTKDNSFVMEGWDYALDTIQRDPYALKDRVDWALRRSILWGIAQEKNLMRTIVQNGQVIGEEPNWNSAVLQRIDLAFDELLDYSKDQKPGKSSYGMVRSLRTKRFAEWLPPADKVQARRHQAPETTRANLRGKLVRAIAAATLQQPLMRWDAFQLRRSGGRTFAMEDPRQTEDEALEALMSVLWNA